MNKPIDLIKATRLLVLQDIYKKHKQKLEELSMHAELVGGNMNTGIKVIRVHLDGTNMGLYTIEAYNEWTLGLSTGQYDSHTATPVYVEDFDGVTTLKDLNNEAEGL